VKQDLRRVVCSPFVVLAVLVPLVASPTPARAQTTPTPAGADDDAKNAARAHFERGLELLSEEAYDAAHVEFALSRKLFATKAATKNAAMCLRRLKRYEESLDLYESLLKDFPNLTENDRAFAEKEIAQIRPFVGGLEIRGGESGAVVTIDGRERGALPIGTTLRVTTGSHLVRVFKSGFAPFESRVEVASGSNATVNVKLAALAQSGHLVVTEQSGKAASVLIDNVVVGPAPWEGTVAIGEHTVLLRGEGELGTQPARARVQQNENANLTLSLESLTSSLRVEPTPVNALVVIDGVSVGRGIWEGRLRSGAHRLEVAEEGFLPIAQSLSLGNGDRSVKAIALERDTNSPLWRASIPSRFVLEATASGALSPGYGGDVAGCSGCSAGLVYGGRARASLAFELGIGLGFSADAGYLWTRQGVDGRATQLSPLPAGSSPAENGTTTHELTGRGATLGGSLFFHRGTKLKWTARVGGGIWLASLTDRRSGEFTTTVSARPDGTIGQPAPYRTDDVEQSQSGQYAFVSPEVRIGLPVFKGAEVSFGIETLLAFALSQPKWDPLGSRVLTGTCRTQASNDCVTDGLAVFDASSLTASTIFLLVPGIALRYEL
jgi:tetratricopeptide (TPR) repeat protein